MSKVTRSQVAENDVFGGIGKSAIDSKGKVDLLKHSIEMLAEVAKNLKEKLSGADPKSLSSMKEFNELVEKANGLASDRKVVNEEMAKAQAKVNEQNQKSNKSIERLTANLDSLKKQRTALNRAEKKGVVTAKEANKERARLNIEIRKSSKELNDATKKQLGLVAAIDEEKKKLTNLIKARQGLSLAGKDNTKTAEQLEKQIERTAKGIDKAEKSTRRFKKGFSGLQSSVDGVRKKLGQLMSALGIVAGFQLFRRVVGNATDIIRDFEKANAELAGVLNTSLDGVSKLTENAKELGSTTAFTASQVTALQIAYSRLGFEQEEIIQLTEGTINGAIALNASLDETAELAGAMVRTFQDLKTTDTDLILDKLTVSTQKSALNFQKLQKALPIVGGAAEAAGINFDKLLALLGKLSDSGIDASTSATALRNIFIESSAQGLTYEQILAKVVKEQDKLTAANDEFGKRAAVSGAILAKNLDATVDLENAISNAGGTAEEVANTQLDTLDGSIKLLQSAWEGWILSINESVDASGFLKNAIRFLADNLDTIMSTLGRLVQVFLTYKATVLLVNFGIKAQAIVTNTLRIAKIALSRGIKGATTAMKKFNAAQKANIIGAIVAVVLLLVQELDNLMSATTAAEDAQNKFNDELSRAQAEAESAFEALKNTTKGTDEHKAALDKVNEVYGTYLTNLLNEESSLKDIERAQELVNRALEKNIALKIQEEETTNARTRAIKSQKDFSSELITQLRDEGKEQSEINQIVAQANTLLKERSKLTQGFGDVRFGSSFILEDKEVADQIQAIDDQIGSLADRANVGLFGFLGEGFRAELVNSSNAIAQANQDILDIEASFSGILGDSVGETLFNALMPAGNSKNAIDNIEVAAGEAKTRLEELREELKKNRESLEKLADENTSSSDERVVSLNTEGRLIKEQIKTIEALLNLEIKTKDTREIANRQRLKELSAQLEAERKLIAFNVVDKGNNPQGAQFFDREKVERDLQIKLRQIRLEFLNEELAEKEAALIKNFDTEGKLFEEAQKLRLEKIKLENEIRDEQFNETQEGLLKEELDLQNDFLSKKLNNELGNDKQIEEAEKDLQKKLIDLQIERLRNEKFILDEESLEYKKLTEKIFSLQQKRADLDKKDSEEEKLRFENRRQAIEIFTDFFVQQADKRIAKIDEEIAAAQRQADTLSGLAQSGNITAQQSLAQQDQIIKEAQRRREELEKRKQRVLLASSILQTYNSELATGKTSGEAFASAITSTTVLQQFIEALPTFFEGTENVGQSLGVPHLNTSRDQYILRADGTERIVDGANNKKIGNISNDDLARIAEDHRAGKYIVDATYMQASNGGQTPNKELLSEIRGMRKDIQGQPKTENKVGEILSSYMTFKTTQTKGNEVTQTTFKVE